MHAVLKVLVHKWEADLIGSNTRDRDQEIGEALGMAPDNNLSSTSMESSVY